MATQTIDQNAPPTTSASAYAQPGYGLNGVDQRGWRQCRPDRLGNGANPGQLGAASGAATSVAASINTNIGVPGTFTNNSTFTGPVR